MQVRFALITARAPLDRSQLRHGHGTVREIDRFAAHASVSASLLLGRRQSQCTRRDPKSMPADCSTIQSRSLDKSGVASACLSPCFAPQFRDVLQTLARYSLVLIERSPHPRLSNCCGAQGALIALISPARFRIVPVHLLSHELRIGRVDSSHPQMQLTFCARSMSFIRIVG